MDRILELDLDWNPLRLRNARLNQRAAVSLAAPHRPFRRTSAFLKSRGLGTASRVLRLAREELGRRPHDGEAASTVGRAYLAVGRFDEAFAHLRGAGRGADARVMLCRAQAAMSVGDVHAAQRHLGQGLERHSSNAAVFSLKSELHRVTGDLKAARAAIERAIDIDPRDSAALVLSGRLGRPRHLEEALSLDPDGFWPLVYHGWLMLKAGRPGLAVGDFSRLTSLHPTCGWAWYWLALSRAQAGDARGADRDRERAICLDPAAIWSYSPLAATLGAWTDWSEVLAACENSLKRDPKDAMAYALRAECRDQHDLVLQDWRRAISLDAGKPWFHAFLARTLAYYGDAPGAFGAMNAAIARWPDCGWFYSWRGEIHKRQGDLAAALSDQQKAISLGGELSRAYSWRGALRRLGADAAGAQADLDCGLELDAEYAAWSLNEKRHIHWAQGEYAEAFTDMQWAASRDGRLSFMNAPDGRQDAQWALKSLAQKGARLCKPWSSAWRGEIQLRRGRLREAKSALDKALREDPRCALAYLWRAEWFFAQARPLRPSCRADLKRAMALAPRLSWTYALNAQLAAEGGRHAEAAADLEVFSRLSIKDCGASLYRARLLRRCGRPEEAERICGRLLAGNPNDSWAYQERALDRLKMEDIEGAHFDQREAKRRDFRLPWIFGFPNRVLARDADRLDWVLGELSAMTRGGKNIFWPLLWRGRLFLDADRLEEAQRDLSRALRLRPDNAWAWGLLGALCLKRGRLDGASAALSQARRGKKHAWIEALRGEVAARLGRAGEASSLFERALRLDPGEDLARLGRLHLRELRGDMAGALEDVECALKSDGTSAGLFLRRGRILMALGRISDAEADASSALAIHGQYAEAFYLRGQARRDLGRREQALADLESAVKLAPERADFRLERDLLSKRR